eukprot:NODE_1650_length_1265_cov_44.631810_g1635_i0.p1 GENE.NODE_1650_length_1265_cov_44.631810_g1635_i0~~NODE_1650_length_1265_cov_44.631810_g1635_i0.p1  ORF type:complete len:404 (-),score=100.11 NODE_1650_length_1265_cov_44.631810_g1635_i0:52-1221(-)
MALIKAQRAYVYLTLGRPKDAQPLLEEVTACKAASTQALASASNNLAALHGDKDRFDSLKRLKYVTQANVDATLTSHQRLVAKFNNALLMLSMNKVDNCRSICDQLMTSSSDLGPLALCALHVKDNKLAQAKSALQGWLQQPGCDAHIRVWLTLAQLSLMQNDVNSAIATLSAVPNKETQPAVLATLVQLHVRQNNAAAGLAVLEAALAAAAKAPESRENKKWHLTLLREVATFQLRGNRFQEAAKSYHAVLQVDSKDSAARCGIIEAYARFDLNEAETVLDRYRGGVDEAKVATLLRDEDELEEMTVPRPRVAKEDASRKRPLEDDNMDQDEDGPADEPQRKKRKKPKKNRHPAKNPDGNPDPERWKPLRERSYYKKQKKKSAKGGKK